MFFTDILPGGSLPLCHSANCAKTLSFMKRILLPTDGTELGDYAYQLAHKIANATGATIETLSIVPAPVGAFLDRDGNLKGDEGDDFADIYQQRAELTDQIEDWAANKDDITDTLVKIGNVEDDILAYTTDNDVDLVVMGTHGAQGWTEVMRSSHTAHIVRSSPVPVLCLKCDRSQLEIRNILLVGDFEELESLNLHVLKEIQRTFDAQLHLLRVNTPKHFRSEREVKAKMQKFVTVNGLENVVFHCYSDHSVEEGIVHFGLEAPMDIVAIGTHQRSSISRLFKHSISEDVVNHLMQPVLAFPV